MNSIKEIRGKEAYMAMNSIQSLDQSQYLNPQVVKSPQTEQAAVEQQNLKAAETDLNKQAASSVQEAFKLNISKEGEARLSTSEKVNKEEGDAQKTETLESESPRQLQTPYSDPGQKASQIINIVA
ncbi:MAG: hypothetical protein KAJ62_09540 [Desulfobacteraceae bacterium]|nr:hypothetical protein [Desulfobacteraceae bacterium]